MNIPKSNTTIQSLQMGWDVVELVARHNQPLKFNEICELSQITKSNLYKYVNTLTQLGILHRDKGSGMYSLGSKLIEYGMRAVNQEDVIERVTPYLQDIHRHCRHTVLFTTWTHSGPVVVKLINSQQGLNIGAQIGTILPLATATGKVYAAFLNDSSVQEWKRQHEARLDAEHATRLEEDIRDVRERRISFAKEPLVPTISSISLPVFKFGGTLIGSFVVVGFADMMPSREEDEMSGYLLQMSAEISSVFGYSLE